MGYVTRDSGRHFRLGSRNREVAYERIRNNAVAQTLRSAGYRFVQLQSTWGATLSNDYADTLVSCDDGLLAIEFFRTLAEASWLRVFTAHASTTLAECHMNNFQLPTSRPSPARNSFLARRPPAAPSLPIRSAKVATCCATRRSRTSSTSKHASGKKMRQLSRSAALCALCWRQSRRVSERSA